MRHTTTIRKKVGKGNKQNTDRDLVYFRQADYITKTIKRDPTIKNDKHFMLKACKVWGFQFNNCSAILKNDLDIIEAAVRTYPEAIFQTWLADDLENPYDDNPSEKVSMIYKSFCDNINNPDLVVKLIQKRKCYYICKLALQKFPDNS